MKGSSQFALTLRKLALLFRRDLAVARSYRAAFLIEIFQALFGSAGFYFLSRFVESPTLERSLPPGTNYFSFALVGIAFFDYLSVGLSTFDASLQEARQNGTLENLLVTQTSLPVILAGSSLYPFALMSLRTAIYIGWGAVLFGFPLHGSQLAGRIAGAGGIGSGVFGPGNPERELSAGLQAGQSGELGHPRPFLRGGRNDVSDFRPAGVVAVRGAAHSGHLFPGRNAGRDFGPCFDARVVAVDRGITLVRGRSSPHLFRDFFLGPAANEDYGHAYPFLNAAAKVTRAIRRVDNCQRVTLICLDWLR